MPQGSRLDNLRAQRLLAAGDLATVRGLAKACSLPDHTIATLEDGGEENNDICQRIADALGVSLATLGQAEL